MNGCLLSNLASSECSRLSREKLNEFLTEWLLSLEGKNIIDQCIYAVDTYTVDKFHSSYMLKVTDGASQRLNIPYDGASQRLSTPLPLLLVLRNHLSGEG
eukprot:GHVL01036026.1.p1 GENE.GHVL01036026.1~~GHVL01036026.1.p1  ORF type:complete len:111 (+),score=24.34 GHVL01036026.1:34-333(+)